MAYNEDSSASGHDEPWIQWFCGLKGHEMFCQVERAYIEDGFNLYGLRACVSNFSDCLDLILDRIGPEDSDDSHLTQSACTLYGLIHARYIVTTHGLDSMYNKYAAKEFGTCPLVQCNGQPVLPVGLRDEIGVDTGKIFCPKCKSVYQPPPIRSRSGHHSSNGGGGGAVDGAAFGTTFPHLFLMTFNNLVPDALPPNSSYIPRVFGFRVHQSAHRQVAGYQALGNGAGRRGYSQRGLANMTSSRVRGNGGGNVVSAVPAQGATSGAPKEGGRVDKGGEVAGATAVKAAPLTPKPSKKPTGNDDGVAVVEGGDAAKDKAAAGNDVGDGTSASPKKRIKSDAGKNGSGSSIGDGANKNRAAKRPKRGEVT